MAETTLDPKEAIARRLAAASFPMGAMPQSGMPCPYNLSETGPAKRFLWCGIWRSRAIYDHYGEDARTFCRTVCHYGQRFAQQRSQVERAHNAFMAVRWQQNRWWERWNALRKWWQRGP